MWVLSEVREKVCDFQKLPLDKSHFITEVKCMNEVINGDSLIAVMEQFRRELVEVVRMPTLHIELFKIILVPFLILFILNVGCYVYFNKKISIAGIIISLIVAVYFLMTCIWIIYTTFGIRTKTWISLFPAYPIAFMMVLSIVIRNLIMKNSNEDMEESEEV